MYVPRGTHTQHHLSQAVHAMQSFDLADRVPRSPSHGTGPAAPDTYSVRDALASLAPHAPDARPRVGILHRTYGDANTHYLGQGASLR